MDSEIVTSTTPGPKPLLLEQRQKYHKRLEFESIMTNERKAIQNEMKDFNFADLPNSVEGLDDLIPERGGKPIRAMIATTWRSGSTFLGDILLSHPGTFYHYEPLLHYNIRQVRLKENPLLAKDALRVIKSLFHCDYINLGHYLKYGKNGHNYLFNHNKRLWRNCKGKNLKMCWEPDFLNRICALYPFQSMKTVRLRLNLTRSILDDTSLNVKVLLIVRDPRGTLQSRKHRDWCPGNPDCDKPEKLCGDLVSDYYAAKTMTKLYPDRFKVVRYEDFSMDSYKHSEEVLNFFGFSMHPKVIKFLDTHTKNNSGGVSSTFRDSKTAPFHWRNDLNFSEVSVIQRKCKKAMKLWGYKEAKNENDLETLTPLLPLS